MIYNNVLKQSALIGGNSWENLLPTLIRNLHRVIEHFLTKNKNLFMILRNALIMIFKI